MRRKIIEQEQDMPADFWNYLVNPILGYYVRPEKNVGIQTEKKYFKQSQSIKQ